MSYSIAFFGQNVYKNALFLLKNCPTLEDSPVTSLLPTTYKVSLNRGSQVSSAGTFI